MPVPLSVVSSVAEFQAAFRLSAPSASPSPTARAATNMAAAAATPRDAFMLCYEVPADNITADSLQAFRDAVDANAEKYGTSLSLHLWDCTSDAFAAAKTQLGKIRGQPLVLVIYHGAIADTVRGASLTPIINEDIPRVCERLAAFQQSSKPAQVVTPSHKGATEEGKTTLRVDVAKIMHLGQDLLGKGEPVYAEKAFIKALDALTAVEPEVRAGGSGASVQDYEGSVAMALAWAGLAQIVQGKAIRENSYLKELTTNDTYALFCQEPLTDACRVTTTQQLMLAAPRVWSGETCSQAKLGAALKDDPMDHSSRAMLVITLFLAGDLERALTEAIKLNSLKQDFGKVALKKIVAFLGPDHVLVQQLSPLTAPSA